MPLPLAYAIGAGVLRFGAGQYQNSQTTKKNKKFARESYDFAADRLTRDQATARQDQQESLAARGLLQGGNAEPLERSNEANSSSADVPNGLVNGKWQSAPDLRGAQVTERAKNPLKRPKTIAGQMTQDTENEFGFEWRDLDLQRRQAEAGIKADASAKTTQDIMAGINTGAAVYGAAKTAGADAGAGGGDYGQSSFPGGMFGNVSGPEPAAVKPTSAIGRAMTGIEDPTNWFGGIDGVQPFNNGSWSRPTTVLGAGQTNAEFTTG